ncbi:acyl-CoA N-acyltransferases superfamily protein [Tanacetum coccineum]
MLLIRVMQEQELDMTVELLAESFAESMMLPKAYVKLLAYLVKQYLVERRGLMPHAATLIAFHRSESESESSGGVTEDIQLEGCEMSLRRSGLKPSSLLLVFSILYDFNQQKWQGIGWQLLKASEELISQMSSVREVYLHCRMIDSAPFNMYSRAGYSVYKTDSILILLTLQRRKHLMCKQLPPATNIVSETDTLSGDQKTLAPIDV